MAQYNKWSFETRNQTQSTILWVAMDGRAPI